MKTTMQAMNTQKPIDLFAEDTPRNKPIAVSSDITGVNGSRLDAHFWLPMAAKTLDISSDIRDFLAIPVVAFFSEIPNTNGDSISKEELLRWQPEYGCPSYMTFKGKPTYEEHKNDVLHEAKGIIFDVYLSKLTNFHGNHYKVVMLAGFDRSKDTRLANSIASGEVNTYSIGAHYDEYICSATNLKYGPSQSPGRFTRPGIPTYMDSTGQLIFRKLCNIRGFELSSVGYPAYTSALSDEILDMS